MLASLCRFDPALRQVHIAINANDLVRLMRSWTRAPSTAQPKKFQFIRFDLRGRDR